MARITGKDVWKEKIVMSLSEFESLTTKRIAKLMMEKMSDNASDDVKEFIESQLKKIDQASSNFKTIAKSRIKTRRYMPKFFESSKTSVAESYPIFVNIFRNLITNETFKLGESKINLKNPWQLVDALSITLTSFAKGILPYNWKSNLKVVDAHGNNICLIHQDKRNIANIILATPEMFAMLSYLVFYSDRIFSEEFRTNDNFIAFEEKMKALVSTLMLAYQYDYENTDANEFLDSIGFIFFPRIMANICELYMKLYRNDEERDFEKDFVGFMYGESELFNKLVEDTLKESIADVVDNIKGFAGGESTLNSITFAKSLSDKILNKNAVVNKENIVEVIQEVVRNNKYKVELNDDGDFKPFIEIANINDLGVFASIWDKNKNKHLDASITKLGAAFTNEKAYRDIKLEIDSIEGLDRFLALIGVSRFVIGSIPDSVKRLMITNIFEREENQKMKSAGIKMIRLMRDMYNAGKFTNQSFVANYEIVEEELMHGLKIEEEDLEESK